MLGTNDLLENPIYSSGCGKEDGFAFETNDEEAGLAAERCAFVYSRPTAQEGQWWTVRILTESRNLGKEYARSCLGDLLYRCQDGNPDTTWWSSFTKKDTVFLQKTFEKNWAFKNDMKKTMVKIDSRAFLALVQFTFMRNKLSDGAGSKHRHPENDFGAINVDMMLLRELEGAENCELKRWQAGGCDKDCYRRRFKLIAMGMCGYDSSYRTVRNLRRRWFLGWRSWRTTGPLVPDWECGSQSQDASLKKHFQSEADYVLSQVQRRCNF